MGSTTPSVVIFLRIDKPKMFKNKNVRLGTVLWLAGMTGVVALSVTMIPQLIALMPASVPAPVSAEAAVVASIVQSGVLLALAVWAGVVLSGSVGLSAPVIARLVAGKEFVSALKRQLLPALVVGALVGGFLSVLPSLMPRELSSVAGAIELPLIARVLYGGVTEELLMRWGVMTLLVWLPWRILQKKNGTPHTVFITLAVVVSAVLFGLGHLPVVAALGGSLSASVALFVVIANVLPGILFGVLFWRFGLEAAIIAHAIAHCVLAVIGG